MAKFSDAFLQGLRGGGRRGSPTDPMLQRADQYGSSNPLAKSIGGMFGMQMDTGQELATKELRQVDQKSPDALLQSLGIQAKYEQDPQKKVLYMAEIAKIQNSSSTKAAQLAADSATRQSVSAQLMKDNPQLAKAVIQEGATGQTLVLAQALGEIGRVETASRETITETMVDPETGVETRGLYKKNSGEFVRELGVAKMPNLTVETHKDGTYTVFNTVTGKRSDPYETVESARQASDQQSKLYASLAGVDAQLRAVTGAALDVDHSSAGLGSLLASIPMTDASLLDSKLMTIRAALAFDRLQAMRDASKTGGALGQVSNIELKLLESAVANLKQGLHPDDLKAQLIIVGKHYSAFRDALLGKVGTAIDWTQPAYAGGLDPFTGVMHEPRTMVADGVRYLFDEVSGNYEVVPGGA